CWPGRTSPPSSSCLPWPPRSTWWFTWIWIATGAVRSPRSPAYPGGWRTASSSSPNCSTARTVPWCAATVNRPIRTGSPPQDMTFLPCWSGDGGDRRATLRRRGGMPLVVVVAAAAAQTVPRWDADAPSGLARTGRNARRHTHRTTVDVGGNRPRHHPGGAGDDRFGEHRRRLRLHRRTRAASVRTHARPQAPGRITGALAGRRRRSRLGHPGGHVPPGGPEQPRPPRA